ncbi:MAG: lamin tail domain-containing protein, partial [Sphingobacteriales bacterium]
MRTCILTLLLGGALMLVALSGKAQAYGRVVINEYMPWPSASCGTTSEFVELLNFGPGPTNIGCYILTNGKYSVTIPPNTILQPGQFFVIAGQSSLPINCGNIDSAVRVHLNWNTCNCTNVAIPTTGDGFMTDGGPANVNMVLFDPTLAVVD